jgi:hypothetical protein
MYAAWLAACDFDCVAVSSLQRLPLMPYTLRPSFPSGLAIQMSRFTSGILKTMKVIDTLYANRS